ncbi:hypothetical protein [Streptosporangium sp. OZ121]|uniref:hypothetical protein n=1 Tax=Streptosporangium sp. OZ121 TaxID=3444183 RepID=UPI003F7981EA
MADRMAAGLPAGWPLLFWWIGRQVAAGTIADNAAERPLLRGVPVDVGMTVPGNAEATAWESGRAAPGRSAMR